MPEEQGEPRSREPQSGDMVGKALRLLTLLGDAPRGMTLSELARQAGYPISTTHRLLSSIAREEFAVLDEERRWNLGLRMFELGQRVLHARGFAGIATPVLQRITRQTGESTLMSVLEHEQQLYVHYVEGSHQVRITGEPGRRGPLHCTAMGKCLIAFAPGDRREQLLNELELPPVGAKTITDRERFRAEVEEVRRRGYAIADEEHEEGIRAIGVPVLDPGGIAVASISAAAPAFRSSIETMHTYFEPLQQGAKELAVGLPSR